MLNDLAPNLIVMPDPNSMTRFSFFTILPEKAVNLENFILPEDIIGQWSLMVLHEAAHIKSVCRINQETSRLYSEASMARLNLYFNAYGPEEDQKREADRQRVAMAEAESARLEFANEIYADAVAREYYPGDHTGFDPEIPVVHRDFKTIVAFLSRSPLTYGEHDTSVVSAFPARETAEKYKVDAARYLREAVIATQALDDIRMALLDAGKDIFTISRQKYQELAVRFHDAAVVPDVEKMSAEEKALLERYLIARSLLDQGRIFDPERKEYIDHFVKAIERRLKKELLMALNGIVREEALVAVKTTVKGITDNSEARVIFVDGNAGSELKTSRWSPEAAMSPEF